MKITNKQLASYLKSSRMGIDGIGYNDNWNMANFGITKATSDAISKAIYEEYGLYVPTKINIAAINRRLVEK